MCEPRVVLVFGADANSDGSVGEETKIRCDKAVEVHKHLIDFGSDSTIIAAAGVDPHTQNTTPLREAMADYLRGRGVPYSDIEPVGSNKVWGTWGEINTLATWLKAESLGNSLRHTHFVSSKAHIARVRLLVWAAKRRICNRDFEWQYDFHSVSGDPSWYLDEIVNTPAQLLLSVYPPLDQWFHEGRHYSAQST